MPKAGQGAADGSTDYESHFFLIPGGIRMILRLASSAGRRLNIHFSNWCSWGAWEQIPLEPGVYTVAKGEPGEIIYIGKTWGGEGLRRRLQYFHRSATTGLKGHAGGVTYHAKFGAALEGLRVACHVPVTIRRDPEILYAYVLYVERRLIWEFVERVGRLPECNSE